VCHKTDGFLYQQGFLGCVSVDPSTAELLGNAVEVSFGVIAKKAQPEPILAGRCTVALTSVTATFGQNLENFVAKRDRWLRLGVGNNNGNHASERIELDL